MNWYTDIARGTWGPFSSRRAFISTLRDAFIVGLILGAMAGLWSL